MGEKKISISLDKKVFDRLEKECKKNYGVSRSKVIEEALRKKMSHNKLPVFSVLVAVLAIGISFLVESLGILSEKVQIPSDLFGYFYLVLGTFLIWFFILGMIRLQKS